MKKLSDLIGHVVHLWDGDGGLTNTVLEGLDMPMLLANGAWRHIDNFSDIIDRGLPPAPPAPPFDIGAEAAYADRELRHRVHMQWCQHSMDMHRSFNDLAKGLGCWPEYLEAMCQLREARS